ncbi:hypothetical protein JCM19235_6521 [Vibrio maritimus]|uniref:Uncharacterized protein n=1 Tax=Vibrio maritimus TaxID=990268 RepID=A0A090RTV8_9VIBR|nr:hypothetical protein JCM19235_6521 [Vibrio maritimus]
MENIDRLVVEDILIPEKLDPREKDYKFLTGAADLNGNGSEELLILMQDLTFAVRVDVLRIYFKIPES